MQVLSISEMQLIEGGVTSPCSALGKTNDVLSMVGAGLAIVAIASTGPVGAVAMSLGVSVGITAGMTSMVSAIRC